MPEANTVVETLHETWRRIDREQNGSAPECTCALKTQALVDAMVRLFEAAPDAHIPVAELRQELARGWSCSARPGLHSANAGPLVERETRRPPESRPTGEHDAPRPRSDGREADEDRETRDWAVPIAAGTPSR